MFLTHNRPHMARQTLEQNLANTGLEPHEFELLVTYNQAKDEPLIEYFKSLNLSDLRLNVYNEGVARSLNQMLIRSRGQNMVFLPDDFLMPDGWLKAMCDFADDISIAGVVGLEGQDRVLPPHIIIGASGKEYECAFKPEVDTSNLNSLEGVQIFGATMFTRRLIDRIGGFAEMFHPYGSEDSDICFRAVLVGFLCAYLRGLKSRHLGVEEDRPNHDEKVKAFFSNVGFLRQRVFNYQLDGLYEPLPKKRGPLT